MRGTLSVNVIRKNQRESKLRMRTARVLCVMPRELKCDARCRQFNIVSTALGLRLPRIFAPALSALGIREKLLGESDSLVISSGDSAKDRGTSDEARRRRRRRRSTKYLFTFRTYSENFHFASRQLEIETFSAREPATYVSIRPRSRC